MAKGPSRAVKPAATQTGTGQTAIQEPPSGGAPTSPPGLGATARATFAGLRSAPRPLSAAALLVAAQGLLVFGLGVLQVVRGFGHGIDNLGRAEAGGVLTLVCGLLVLALAGRMVRDTTASKSPVVVIELLCLPVGWAMADNGLYGYGIPLLAVAVVILALLVASGLRRREEPDDDATPPGA